jgi:peptidoglycan/LPS O-acetylase OafA/YrhL
LLARGARSSGHAAAKTSPRAERCATVVVMRAISSQRPQRSVGRRLAALAAILALYAIVCLAPTACGVAPSAYGLLLAPAFVLFAILLLGCAPGARLLERLRARRFARRAPRAPRTLAMRCPIVARRMAAPAASALAMRPPPVPAAAIG